MRFVGTQLREARLHLLRRSTLTLANPGIAESEVGLSRSARNYMVEPRKTCGTVSECQSKMTRTFDTVKQVSHMIASPHTAFSTATAAAAVAMHDSRGRTRLDGKRGRNLQFDDGAMAMFEGSLECSLCHFSLILDPASQQI